MPFVLRTVQPVFVSRGKLTGPDGKPLVQDYELEAVFNGTLCCAIRQLSSLLEAADDLFAGLTKEMTGITERATALQQRVRRVQDRVDAHDPKLVTVPEGDLTAFSALPRDAHFHPTHLREPTKALFLPASRPAAVQRLYAAAARPTLDNDALVQLDRLRKDGARSSTLFLCTPTLGRTRTQRLRRKVVDIDIETRKPASLVELRRWTSTEALGDMTVHPDCTVRIAGRDADDVDADLSFDASEYLGVDSTVRPGDEPADHQLPTTEEQVKAIADRFPPEVVKVDVTGRAFTRMSRYRRSLLHPPTGPGGVAGTVEEEEARRRTRPRRQRSRRRNTIAGTDQKEIEEALHGDKSTAANTLATVDDIILSSSSMINSNPKSSKETTADFKKWAFNSLRRWGRSRFRASSNSNTSTSSNMVSGELHAADPVDDINVYETVAGKRRGAGTIPISAGISGPMSLAVKLREGSLGQRRLKINDEPPHSSSGNWSASSESGRASVNSDSSHHPKSSTCSSILPHRRRFINNSTSSSVTSEGTLTPEDMAAAPFVDDGETSSVYSCDTEGYYTSFHMDSGLKTLKEEEVGSGLSLPPTPLHSTSALSNCSSGRGSASLAQLTAESEYELFGKGSTSTTASSAGTVCTTLLVDNSRGGDNSLGSDRSLSKGPAVPERKSSLNVPCMAQECPPCSTVVALIHNTSQGHSPRSVSGDSPDSGHNTSSSPIESMSSPQDAETDALISPIPSLTSEMEFSECSDFEGMDRIERIRVKTTINTSRIPSMCAITPPQSDDETSSRQISESSNIQNTADLPRGPAPLPFTAISESNQNVNRNDNYSFNGGIHLTDNNANKHSVDNNFNARSSIALTNSSGRSIIQCDKNSGYATIQTLDNACKENNINQKVRPPSPSGGTLFINTKAVEEESSFHQPFIKDALIPFTSMLSKFRKATSAGHNKSSSKTTDSSKEDSLDESGEYVTITDVKNNNKPGPTSLCTPQRSEMAEPVRESNINKTWESLEYVALNEIATNHSDLFSSDVLSGSSNESSLERQKRRGARVTLDSEGKVVYSSDSLRRRKGAHSTFAPGQHVKDPSVSPSPSPVANHRTPKAIIRPVQQQTPVKIDDSWGKSPLKSNIRSSMSGTLNTTNAQKSESVVPATRNKLNGSNPKTIERSPASATNPKEAVSETQKSALPSQLLDPSNQRNRVIIRAGISSPTREVTKSLSPMRSMSPRSIAVPRGAYVQMPPDRSSVKTHSSYLQTDFDGPEDPVKSPEGIFPPKLFRDSLHHTHHPVPRSSEQVAAAHPVYQNFSGLQRDQPPTNQLTASHNQQRLQGAETSPYRFSSEGTNMGQPIEGPLHSSTPTKPISSLAAPLAVGDTFSPIEKDASQSSKRFPFSDSKFASIGKEEKQSTYESSKQERTPVRESFKSSLVSLPKSTMTSEELYAKIHKSKKQMNIKTDPEIVLSPTPSVCGSQSPVSSERSASPNEPKGGARSRHSWSPNSSKYLDIVSSFDPRSNTPSPNQQVPKEHGLTQITSTHDFKRLLLQHGSGSTIKSKLSAVERLKQAKQAATNVFTNNSAKLRFGSNSTAESTSTSVARLANHPQPPPSKAPTSQPSLLKPGLKYAWRFSGHKNDVRSSPIMEDQREYENIPVAPVPDVLQIQTLSSSPMPARNVGRSFTRTGPRSQTSLGKTSSLPMNSESNPNTRVQQVQNHTAVTHSKAMLNTKQHSIGSRPTLPPTVEGFGTSNSGKGSPTALETAL